jgi:uncharacterized protein (DUF433 family)
VATTASTQAHVSRVSHDATVQGGEPVLAGTRTTVRSIVLAARAEGTVAGVLDWYPHLTAADIAEALAYYEAHRALVDELIAANTDA